MRPFFMMRFGFFDLFPKSEKMTMRKLTFYFYCVNFKSRFSISFLFAISHAV